ncbi:MAG: ABC transporter ATP-binding protein [Planctomycetota bacterium]
MIRIANVTKRFGRAAAVDDVTLEIPAGDSVALWGLNGAGKTTLIRCVLGLLRFRGVIEVGGHDVSRRGKVARMLIGYVPQELGFYDDLGVTEALRFFARLRGIALAAPEEVLVDVGLEEHGRKRIRELSGGMKQRLALAIALIGDPPVLVLDEVTASLDACGREELVALLARLRGAGRTLLFASHRVEEVTALAKRVVVLRSGRIESEATATAFGSGATAGGVLLHLHLRATECESAMNELRAAGFDPRLNGAGVFVPVAAERKIVPLRILAEARIAVDDFELIGAGRAVSDERAAAAVASANGVARAAPGAAPKGSEDCV